MAAHFPIVDWAIGSGIYEVNIRQYTPQGTFKAFQKHLPRLKDMGVKILWFMPVTPISVEKRQGSLGSYYACSHYCAINPEFGTIKDFKALVDEAHQLDFKVIIDWVANHTGWGHEWAKHHPDWYMKNENGHFIEENNWIDVIDLDYDNFEMRDAMVEAMKYWIKEFDIDGFRCDMAHLVPLDFWKEARLQCEELKPLFWLAECEVAEYHDVFDVSYAWHWMHVTEKYFRSQASIGDIYNVLHAYSQYHGGSYKLFFTSNHDENSWNGTEYEKYDGAAKAMAVFTCTWCNGFPLIYTGQELPNMKRVKFFDKDEIEWKEPAALHDFYKTLLTLNKADVVAKGESFILPTNNNNLMAYLRRSKDDVLLVILNLSGSDRIKVEVEHEWLKGEFQNVFSGFDYKFNFKESFELQSNEYLVYKRISS